MIANNKKSIAFWIYNSGSHKTVLFGEVDKIQTNGKVSVKGYNGMIFKPIQIMDYDEGVAAKEELLRAEKEMRENIEKEKNKYYQEADRLMKCRWKLFEEEV